MAQKRREVFLVWCLVYLSIALGAHASSIPASYGYGPKPDLGKPAESQLEDPSITAISVQGLVSCRSASKLSPLQGAVVRLTCLAIDGDGYESAPFSILTCPTDENGYFFTTLELTEVDGMGKVSECKAFLNSSPSDTCNIPTDVNDGVTGSLLGSYRLLNDKKVKLYSVGPFVYTSGPTSIDGGY